jgi:putative ABC transport system permease protein
MLKVMWRNLLARKVRLALSAFAIVLGVAFVAGSFIFTDALSGAFNGIVKGTTADVEVQPKGNSGFDATQDTRVLTATDIANLGALPEASAVAGNVSVQNLWVISADGKLVGGNGPPGLGLSYTETKAITGQQIITLSRGDLPAGPDEVALDEKTADKAGYEIGDQVTLVPPSGDLTIHPRLSGLIHFGSSGGLVGATLTVFDTTGIQDRFFGGRDVYTGASLTTAEGVTQAQLADAAARVLPTDFEALQGDKLAKDNEEQIGKILTGINTFLLVFAAVSLVVGTFLIVNTFSILLAQRSRELALLRAMGASRRQVNRSVLAEAFVVGLIGSTVGIGVGYLLALGLKALFSLIGLDIGSATFPLKARTIVISYLVGLVVTMVAAYLPARRASRVAPVAAMRDDIAIPESALRVRLIVGVLLVAGGIGVTALGLFASVGNSLLEFGLGVLGILVGVALIAPVLARPIIRAVGVLYRRLFGTVGLLATQNSVRNPRRTAATASALMIGLTLMTLMSVFVASAKSSFTDSVSTTLEAPLVVSNATGQGFSTSIAKQVRQVDGVGTVSEFRIAPNAKINGDGAFVGAADPAQIAKTLNIQIDTGALGSFVDKAILVDATTARSEGLVPGDVVTLEIPGATEKLIVAGTYAASSMPASYLVTLDALKRGSTAPADSYLFISLAPGADESTVRQSIDKLLSDLPTVTLKNQQEFIDEQVGQLNILLYIIDGLLGLAIVIAILGIINTLALSVIERTREVGLLRAVGLSRRQLKRMVRLESIAIALLGTVLGLVLGIAFGVSLQRALRDDGVGELTIPWGQLGIFVVAAVLVGVLAAWFPARRAARLDVLRAITTE